MTGGTLIGSRKHPYLSALLAVVVLVACASVPVWAAGIDPRFAMSGWAGWGKFDEVGSSWWLNWDKSISPSYVNVNYPYLRMYWRTRAGEYTDTQIQDWARAARSLYGPGVPIVWTASNEPNDRGQANQTPAEFADGYYQYHKNLKIGDPDCKVIGPGILDWTFLSTSVWQKGKDWYAELRQVWANNPTYSAYSLSIQGNSYPPMDAFNMHTYDLRGVQGTPWAEPDWKYLRDETIACYNDLQTYPETKNLKIWNTEYGSLRAGNITESADALGGFVLWLREQSYMEKWFFFIISSWDGSWSNTILLNYPDNTINALGKAHYALSTMGDAEVYNMPHDDPYSVGTEYTRPGATYTDRIAERYYIGLELGPQSGYRYNAGEMRGKTYAATRRIKRVTLNYRMTCDPSLFRLEIDIPGHPAIYTSGANTLDQWVDLDLSAYQASSVSLGLYCAATNTYSGSTWGSYLQINNITLWLDNTVIDATPALAKSLPDLTHVSMPGAVVSAVYANSFAIQSEDRSSGIMVVGKPGLQVGDRCTITGDTATIDGSRVLVSPLVKSSTHGAPPAPLALNTLALGGGSFGLQSGVVDNAPANGYAAGLSNVGLLVRTAGSVTYVDPGQVFFYLDDGARLSDGSGYTGTRVSLALTPVPIPGTTASATGVSSTTIVNGKVARLLCPRSAQDVSFGAIYNDHLFNSGFESGLASWASYGSVDGVQSGLWLGDITAHSGDYFLGTSAIGDVKSGGVYQRVAVTAGSSYKATVWSRIYHGDNSIDSAQSRVGIDPNGGTNPNNTSIRWSVRDVEPAQYASSWRQLTSPTVSSTSGYVTIFLDFKQYDTNGWHINCFDDVTLVPV